MPPSITADSGIDALTHALEAVVSIFASPYTDAFCVQAARLIFDALPRGVRRRRGPAGAHRHGQRRRRWPAWRSPTRSSGPTTPWRTRSGARFHLPHGRANGIFLPHVLRYNAALPAKFMPAPGYSSYVAPGQVRPARPGGLRRADTPRSAAPAVQGRRRPARHAAHAAGRSRTSASPRRSCRRRCPTWR